MQLSTVLELIGRVVAPASLLTAMFYFFGYTREREFYRHFGVDLGTVGLSTTDYLIRSAGVAFVPLAVLAVVAAVAIIAQPVVTAELARCTGRTGAVAVGLLATAAVALMGVAVTGLVTPAREIGSQPLAAPIALGCATLVTGYGLALVERHAATPAGMRRTLAAGRATRISALAILIIISVFWLTANIGADRGRAAAGALERTLVTQPQAIVFSRQKLYISGRGVMHVQLDSSNSRYAFRYNGLRVLLHNAGRWFLLPAGWHRGDGTVVILPDNDPDIRVDLAA
ncbi:hypothetical protein ACG83_31305 [Frankia sp. R43]|nr:hypothetical protein ACG83_31305 [Frankia sp. R43]